MPQHQLAVVELERRSTGVTEGSVAAGASKCSSNGEEPQELHDVIHARRIGGFPEKPESLGVTTTRLAGITAGALEKYAMISRNTASRSQICPMNNPYDAILILSFGGPEGMDDVMPFLENVTRGRNIPVERLQAVAHHYEIFGGVSPINAHNRALISALKEAFDREKISLPIYWGNRNWHPFVEDTFKEMTAAGVQKVLAFVTSAYASYSGCRMYLNDVERAKTSAGADSPIVHKLPLFFDHPLFVEANSEHLMEALHQLPADRAQSAQIVFTAHSVPQSMAANCQYEAQLARTASLICERTGRSNHAIVYQSRSGPPNQPWLGPDICDYLKEFAASSSATKDIIVQPIGFISDHMEVMYDIEIEAKQVAAECGLNLIRAATAGTHPAFVQMIVELIKVRLQKPEPDSFLSCPPDCCPSPQPSAPSRPLNTQGREHD